MASEESQINTRIPLGTWDSHMHVVDPDNYELHGSAQYKPHPHTLKDALEYYDTIGIRNCVFVQPSIFGNDNSCMLDALKVIGPQRGRAVVTFNPDEVTQDQLREWHDIGVRGVRVNFKSVGRTVSKNELEAELKKYAEAIKPLKTWVLQVYTSLDQVPLLESIVPDLGVKFCIDHFGHPALPAVRLGSERKIPDPYELDGFQSLVNLLKSGSTFVKISAPYRLVSSTPSDSSAADDPWIGALAKELLKVAPERCVVATDWPHTRFEGTDVKPFLEKCLEWCSEIAGDEVGGKAAAKLSGKLFVRNARVLWDVQDE